MARPSTGKTNIFRVRLNDELRERVEAAAGGNVSEYIRNALEDAVDGLTLHGADAQIWDEVCGFVDFGGQTIGSLVKWLDDMIVNGIIIISDDGFRIEGMAQPCG